MAWAGPFGSGHEPNWDGLNRFASIWAMFWQPSLALGWPWAENFKLKNK